MKILLFKGENCLPCKNFKATYEKVKENYSDFEFAEYDNATDLKEFHKYKPKGIPTTIFLIDNVEVGRLLGSVKYEKIEEEIKKIFSI